MIHTVKEGAGAAYLLATVSPMHRVGNFRPKKKFRRTKKKQTLIILFRTLPRRENNSKFLSVQQKIETNSRNVVPYHSVEEKPTQNKTRQPNISKIVSERTTLMYRQIILLSNFAAVSAEFRSVPSFGIGSSAELGMPRNESFLPRNNGSCSESIPRNFFGTKFRS
jgi:hypothetical protein